MNLSHSFNQFAPITGTLVPVGGVFVFIPSLQEPSHRPLFGVFEDCPPLMGVYGGWRDEAPQWSGSRAPDPYARRCGQDMREWLAELPPRWTM